MIRRSADALPGSKTSAPRRLVVTLSLVLLSLAVLMTAAGCKKKQSGVDPSSLGPSADTNSSPAPTATLSADPLIIDLGSSTVLTWHTSNASIVTIDGIGQVNLNGTQTVSPSNPTNFHLVAKGDGGTVEANVRVTVRMKTVDSGGSTVMDTNRADTSHGVTDDIFHQNVPDAFFDYDSYELRADAQAASAQAAGFLVAHPNIKVLIGGYCDERGSAEYNAALGENRANSAKTALVNAGVSPQRIRVISYGKEKQFCTESNEACWQENRRAQFTIDR